MGQFKYKAVGTNGEVLQGVFKAKTRKEVIQMLRENQSYPVSIEEEYTGVSREVKIFTGIRTKDIAIFCRQLYAMLYAGVPIVTSLNTLWSQTEHKSFKKVIGEIYESVNEGSTLSESMRRFPDYFSELMINMILAGESSGSLDMIIQRLAVHYEKENKIQNKIKGALVYPIVLAIVCVLVVTFLLTFVMPKFITLFTNTGVELPLPTQVLLFMSQVMTHYWYLIFGSLGLLFYGLNRYVMTAKGRRQYDGLILKTPVLGSLTRKIAVARFSRTLSTMLSSGVPLIEALENVEKVVGNRVLVEGLSKVREEVQRGSDLATPIRRYAMFPPMVGNMIQIGEESGTLDDMLDKTANFYDEEVDTGIQQLVTLFEPLMIMVMAAIVGFIVISIAMPLFKMFEAVKRS